jgi:chemotaxis protein methyltransferase WspC
MKHIEALLRHRIGLDAAAIGSAGIERVVRRRMQALGLSRPRDYAALLESAPPEWELFLESVVVCETWFFRERATFRTLVTLVRTRWLPTHPQGRFRVLSAACASGEEPYSIVMALLDAGVPPERFSVEGVDVSARALERAERAVFGKNSFRGRELQFRQRYFRATPEGSALLPPVRRCVQFRRANVLDGDLLHGGEPYDFVFCRNLLIYFDRETQARALERLAQLLLPDGALFVGAAELAVAAAHGFAPLPAPFALACRPVSRNAALIGKHGTLQPDAESLSASGNGEAGTPPAAQNPDHPVHAAHRSQAGAENVGDSLDTASLAAARQLADAGRLADALAVCQAHLQQHGPSAAGFHLLGLLEDARGETGRAIECYRKALYLEPDHLESLMHLALVLERNGDAAGAQVLRRRAARVQARQPVPS